MRNFSGNPPYIAETMAVSTHLRVWNRRLLIGALVFILWGATVLALHVADPTGQSLMAAEGIPISETQ
jgi:hypothetical protein